MSKQQMTLRKGYPVTHADGRARVFYATRELAEQAAKKLSEPGDRAVVGPLTEAPPGVRVRPGLGKKLAAR